MATVSLVDTCSLSITVAPTDSALFDLVNNSRDVECYWSSQTKLNHCVVSHYAFKLECAVALTVLYDYFTGSSVALMCSPV